MKKIKISLILLGLISSLNADILRVESGAGVWSQNQVGETSYTNNNLTGRDVVTEKEDNKGYAWILLKQPIPLIPNLRLEYSNVGYDGKVSGSFANFNLPDTLGSDSYLNINQFDVIPYYNIIDNTFWITLDLGVDIKILETTYIAGQVVEPNTGLTFEGYNNVSTTLIPLGYMRGRVQIPTTDIGIESDIKYISLAGNSIIDFRAKVDYTFDIFPIVQPGIELGYRYQKINIDDGEGTLSNLEFSGIYAGIMVRF